MTDSETAAVRRFRMQNDELVRRHRGLAARLERVDVELERATMLDRLAELRAERERITHAVGEVERRIRASWDQVHRGGGQPPDPALR